MIFSIVGERIKLWLSIIGMLFFNASGIQMVLCRIFYAFMCSWNGRLGIVLYKYIVFFDMFLGYSGLFCKNGVISCDFLSLIIS